MSFYIFFFYENCALVIQIIVSLCCKELVWNARLQPAAEYPMEQIETETSRSPTGTVQSFSPTWEMLQVPCSTFVAHFLFFFLIVYTASRHVNLNAGDDSPTAVHGCQMGALPAAFPNDIKGRSAVAARTVLDAAIPPALGAMVHLLGHHRAARGRASAQQTTHGRQSDESGTRPYSGLLTLPFRKL